MKKVKTIRAFGLLVLIAGLLLPGCAKKAGEYDYASPEVYEYEASEERYVMDEGLGGGVPAPPTDDYKAKDSSDIDMPASMIGETGGDYYEEATGESESDITTTAPATGDTTAGEKSIENAGKSTERLMIIKTADLSFEVKKVEEANNEVLAIASKYNAIIVDSHKYKDDDGHSFAATSIRVEPQYFEKMIADLKAIEGGDLTNEQITGTDVTKEYVDLKARLKNKKEVEIQYQELLKRSGSIPDVLAVQRELERVRGEIESLEGQIRYYENQVGLSTITVNLSEPSVSVPGSRSFGDDMKDAFRTMIAICIFFVQAFIVLLPFIVLIMIIYFIIRIIIKLRKPSKA